MLKYGRGKLTTRTEDDPKCFDHEHICLANFLLDQKSFERVCLAEPKEKKSKKFGRGWEDICDCCRYACRVQLYKKNEFSLGVDQTLISYSDDFIGPAKKFYEKQRDEKER